MTKFFAVISSLGLFSIFAGTYCINMDFPSVGFFAQGIGGIFFVIGFLASLDFLINHNGN